MSLAVISVRILMLALLAITLLDGSHGGAAPSLTRLKLSLLRFGSLCPSVGFQFTGDLYFIVEV